MVKGKKIIVSNGNTSEEMTHLPYTVSKTKGFDRLSVQMVTSQGFNQDGAYLANEYIMPREMGIEGEIKADTAEEMQKLKDSLINLFAPKKEITINYFFGGFNRLITARVEKTTQFTETDVSKIIKYAVEMTALDPYWRDVSDTIIHIAETVGSFHFPLIIPKKKGITFGIKKASLIADVFNHSAVKVGMNVEFIANGSVSNPQLFHINTRQYFRLICDMQAGEKIVVKTGEEKSVTRIRNGLREDYIGKIDITGGNTFLELQPGENLLRHLADSGERMLEVRISFSNKYLGV